MSPQAKVVGHHSAWLNIRHIFLFEDDKACVLSGIPCPLCMLSHALCGLQPCWVPWGGPSSGGPAGVQSSGARHPSQLGQQEAQLPAGGVPGSSDLGGQGGGHRPDWPPPAATSGPSLAPCAAFLQPLPSPSPWESPAFQATATHRARHFISMEKQPQEPSVASLLLCD